MAEALWRNSFALLPSGGSETQHTSSGASRMYLCETAAFDSKATESYYGNRDWPVSVFLPISLSHPVRHPGIVSGIAGSRYDGP